MTALREALFDLALFAGLMAGALAVVRLSWRAASRIFDRILAYLSWAASRFREWHHNWRHPEVPWGVGGGEVEIPDAVLRLMVEDPVEYRLRTIEARLWTVEDTLEAKIVDRVLAVFATVFAGVSALSILLGFILRG